MNSKEILERYNEIVESNNLTCTTLELQNFLVSRIIISKR